MTKSTHRYFNIAKLLYVVDVVIGHERPWHVYVIVLSSIVHAKHLLRTSPSFSQFASSLSVVIRQYIYDWNFRRSIALHVLSHNSVLVDGFVLTLARKHIVPFFPLAAVGRPSTTFASKKKLLLLPCMSVLFYYVQNPSVLLPLSVRGPGFIITFPSSASALRSRLSPPLLYWDAAAADR